MNNKVWVVVFFLLFVVLYGEDEVERPAVQALRHYEQEYSVIMNNVVNAQTPGYRATQTIVRNENGKIITEAKPILKKGALIHSGDPFHIGIEGPGYYMVETSGGTPLYTRDGRFKLNSDFELVTLSKGYVLQGESGPIVLAPDEAGSVKFNVTQGGLIVQGDNIVDRILVGNINDFSSMELIGGVFFRSRGTAEKKGQQKRQMALEFEPMAKFKVRQGYYEGSNVQITKELINLPSVSKKYDANSKVLQMQNKAYKSAMEMGRTQ